MVFLSNIPDHTRTSILHSDHLTPISIPPSRLLKCKPHAEISLVYPLILFRISPSIAHATTTAIQTVSQRRRTTESTIPKSAGKHHTKSVDARHSNSRTKRDETVEDGARIDVSSKTLPLHAALRLRQRRCREPAHREAKRQGIPNDELPRKRALHVAERTGAVRNARVQHAAVVRSEMVLRRAVQQHVHVGADVHVAQLQRAGHGEDERDVLALGKLLADDLDVLRRARGETAR